MPKGKFGQVSFTDGCTAASVIEFGTQIISMQTIVDALILMANNPDQVDAHDIEDIYISALTLKRWVVRQELTRQQDKMTRLEKAIETHELVKGDDIPF